MRCDGRYEVRWKIKRRPTTTMYFILCTTVDSNNVFFPFTCTNTKLLSFMTRQISERGDKTTQKSQNFVWRVACCPNLEAVTFVVLLNGRSQKKELGDRFSSKNSKYTIYPSSSNLLLPLQIHMKKQQFRCFLLKIAIFKRFKLYDLKLVLCR